jgi:hypothetical protein
MLRADASRKRCAIYTRKFSEEGLSPTRSTNGVTRARIVSPRGSTIRSPRGGQRGDGAYRGLRPAHKAPGRYSLRLTTAAGARGHSIPRARGADFPPRSPAAAKPTLLTGWGRLLLPGSKPLLHPADMASRPIRPAPAAPNARG